MSAHSPAAHPPAGGVVTIDQDHGLALTAEASPHAARELRLQLEQWLRAIGATPTMIDDFGLAAYEALANVAEHAYPADHDDPVVGLDAGLDGEVVQIAVYDHGWWTDPGDLGYRGRGITMMRHLASEVDIEPGYQGTTVRLQAFLGAPGAPCAAPDRSGCATA